MTPDKIRLGDLPLLGRLCIYSEFLYGLCNGAWAIALSFHLSANGVSERQIGVLLCAGYLVTAVASFFVGRIGDRRGFPFVMGAGALLMGAGLLIITWVRQLPLFYLGHGVYCVGLAGLMSAVAVVGAKLSNNQHKVDQAWDWLRRIWIAWMIINGIGAFIAYVTPLFSGLATLTP